MTKRSLKLLRAEYKGIKFGCKSETETGGRSLVIKRYPNSDEQSIQDMGGIPQSFTVPCTIYGKNFIVDAKKFTELLTDGEIGDLILPNFGILKAYAHTYRKTSSEGMVGVINFDVTFEIEKMGGASVDETATDQDVYNAYLDANDSLEDALAELWTPPTSNGNNLSAVSDAKSALESAKSAMSDINSAVRQIEKNVALVESVVSEAEAYAELMVSDGPFAVLASLTGIGSSYQKAKDMVDWGRDLPNRLTQIASTITSAEFYTDKNFSIPVWESNMTAEWDERNKNRVISVETTRLGAMQCLFNDVYNLDVLTFDELAYYQTDLQTLFDSVTQYQNSILCKNQAYMKKLLDLKDVAMLFLRNKQDEVFYRSEISVNNMPVNVLSHLLYGEETRAEIELRSEVIKGMNDGKHILDGKDVVVLEKQ